LRYPRAARGSTVAVRASPGSARLDTDAQIERAHRCDSIRPSLNQHRALAELSLQIDG